MKPDPDIYQHTDYVQWRRHSERLRRVRELLEEIKRETREER